MNNITLNFQRLKSNTYSLENLFRPATYEWQGDWEGRALLAFTCHYQMHGGEVSQLHPFFEAIPRKTNGHFYFGQEFDGVTVNEQQLSGHNWYLRGLLKYARLFNSKAAMDMAKSTVERLYLPILPWYDAYPLKREEHKGGVGGNISGSGSGWLLSTDVGCAFMCVDGLAHYYVASRDERVKRFLDRVIGIFEKTDLLKYKFQTHTTLSCARGILKLYEGTGDDGYLEIAEKIFDFYTKHGMTLTYENFNWFGRQDTWTEPCAVVDSFILATELYKITRKPEYRTLARRIWFNGLQFCQRENGGAGPNTCVTENNGILKIFMYEAPFCCTMRYAEGLLEYYENRQLFSRNEGEKPVSDEFGRTFADDKLLVKYNGKTVPIFSCNTIPEQQAKKIELSVF